MTAGRHSVCSENVEDNLNISKFETENPHLLYSLNIRSLITNFQSFYPQI